VYQLLVRVGPAVKKYARRVEFELALLSPPAAGVIYE
jgi:hypothetical protein